MPSIRLLAIVLLGSTAACSWQAAALAADLVVSEPGTIVQPGTQLPAVSGINGKWEFAPGILTGAGGVRGAGSISVPIGQRFGLQFDGSALWNGSFTWSGAAHSATNT